MLHGLFSLRYLLLRRGNGTLLASRDIIVLLAALVIYIVLAYLVPNLNFFGVDGFIDRVGSLTSTLTGFYVAALVAAATFASSHADLDQEITIGPIHQNFVSNGEIERDQLTRREYVCAIFGYVSLLALVISISSIIIVTISTAISISGQLSSTLSYPLACVTHITGGFFTIAVTHLIVTTSHGLYYLSYRLYIGDGQIVSGQWDDVNIEPSSEKTTAQEL